MLWVAPEGAGLYQNEKRIEPEYEYRPNILMWSGISEKVSRHPPRKPGERLRLESPLVGAQRRTFYSRKALPSRTVFSTLLADKVVSILRARFKIAQYVQDIIFMTPIKGDSRTKFYTRQAKITLLDLNYCTNKQ